MAANLNNGRFIIFRSHVFACLFGYAEQWLYVCKQLSAYNYNTIKIRFNNISGLAACQRFAFVYYRVSSPHPLRFSIIIADSRKHVIIIYYALA